MHPVLFSIGDFPIGTYGVLIVIGLVAAIFLGSWLARKINLRADYIYDLTFVMLIAGFLGARLLFIIVEWDQFLEAPMSMILSRQGFVFQGGLIAALVAGGIYCRWHKLPIFEIADLGMPALALGHGIGRIGCFLAGCCYGLSIMPGHEHEGLGKIAVQYPLQYDANGQISNMFNQAYWDQLTTHKISPGTTAPLPIVPVQLFETVGNLIICVILLMIWKRRKFSGQVGASYLILYGALRFGLEYLRGDMARGVYFGGLLSTGQLISLAMIAGGISILLLRRGTPILKMPAEAGLEVPKTAEAASLSKTTKRA